MKAVENWVQDIIFYMFFVTMVMNLLPDPKYEKYLRLFAGAVMILLAFGALSLIMTLVMFRLIKKRSQKETQQ